jgi:hypothetical protein
MTHDEALAVLGADPHNAQAWLALGQSLAARGLINNARGCFERALMLDPALEEARQALTEIKQQAQTVIAPGNGAGRRNGNGHAPGGFASELEVLPRRSQVDPGMVVGLPTERTVVEAPVAVTPRRRRPVGRWQGVLDLPGPVLVLLGAVLLGVVVAVPLTMMAWQQRTAAVGVQPTPLIAAGVLASATAVVPSATPEQATGQGAVPPEGGAAGQTSEASETPEPAAVAPSPVAPSATLTVEATATVEPTVEATATEVPTATAEPTTTARPTSTETPPSPTASATEAASEGELTGPRVRVPGDGANLRSGPGTNFAIVAWMTQGQEARALAYSENRSWIQVEFEDVTGWVATTLVTVIDAEGLEP